MIVHNPNNLSTIPIADLLPSQGDLKDLTEKNYNKLKNVILNRGFSVPVYIWENEEGIKYLLDGHQRQRVLTTEGWNEPIPYLTIPAKDLQEAMARLLEITSQYATITQEGIDEFISKYDLNEAEVYEATSYDALRFGEPEPEIEVVEDEAPEVDESEPPKSKLGEVYQLGRHRLACGDATKREDVDRLMNGQKADMVFTDPPYGVSYQSNMRTKTEKFDVIKNDDVIDGRAIELAYEYSTGWVLVCTGWTVLTEWLSIIDDKITNLIVWDKGGGGMGDLKRSLLTDYELIMAYNRGNEIVGKRLGSVWSIGKDFAGSYAHPTQKPVELPAQAIKTFSTGSVLDLFLGSGSTLIACEQTDRTCYGMELDEKYLDVIRKRWVKYVHGEEALENDKWIELTPAIE